MRLLKTITVAAAALCLGAGALAAQGADDSTVAPVVKKLEEKAMGTEQKDDMECCAAAEKAGLVCGICDPSAKAEVGKPAVNFQVKDVDGKSHLLSDYAGKVVVLTWVSNSCPFMIDLYKRGETEKLTQKYKDNKEVVFINIDSNAKEDAASIKETQKQFELKTMTLVDQSGAAGKMYQAKTTPNSFVIAKDGKLAYAGAFSNTPMGELEGQGPAVNYVDAAVTSLLAGEPVKVTTTKSWGCGVKYAS